VEAARGPSRSGAAGELTRLRPVSRAACRPPPGGGRDVGGVPAGPGLGQFQVTRCALRSLAVPCAIADRASARRAEGHAGPGAWRIGAGLGASEKLARLYRQVRERRPITGRDQRRFTEEKSIRRSRRSLRREGRKQLQFRAVQSLPRAWSRTMGERDRAERLPRWWRRSSPARGGGRARRPELAGLNRLTSTS
jgi:hypothetical protein